MHLRLIFPSVIIVRQRANTTLPTAISPLYLYLLSLLAPTDPHDPLGQLFCQLCPLPLGECASTFDFVLTPALLDPLQHLVVLLHYLREL